MYIDPSTKKKLEILIAVAVIFGLIVAVVVLLNKRDGGGNANPDRIILESELPENFDPNVVNGTPTYVSEPIARAFVERFGSFSSQSGYTNIDDVEALATESLKARLRAIAEDARADAGDEFYGISTQVIAITTESVSEGTMTLRIGTQRTESIESPANSSTRNQEILVTLNETASGWLVSDFEWQE